MNFNDLSFMWYLANSPQAWQIPNNMPMVSGPLYIKDKQPKLPWAAYYPVLTKGFSIPGQPIIAHYWDQSGGNASAGQFFAPRNSISTKMTLPNLRTTPVRQLGKDYRNRRTVEPYSDIRGEKLSLGQRPQR